MKRKRYYKPLPDCLTIRESDINGIGLFAAQDIDSGKNLGITHLYDWSFEDSYIRTPLGGFINHSDDPNCETIKIGKYFYLITIKDIMPDEEITLKYTLYNVLVLFFLQIKIFDLIFQLVIIVCFVFVLIFLRLLKISDYKKL